MTNSKIRTEEYSALGDFIMASFERDQAAIMAHFPKLNTDFFNDLTAKLEEIKTLESGLVQTEQRKNATAALYAEAAALNKNLNFLSLYMREAGLSSAAVTDLKDKLTRGNIEGAILKIESIKQFVAANHEALEAEGLAGHFADVLDGHKMALAAKNAQQNILMNSRKQLTAANKAQYNKFYDYLTKVARAGKLVFDGDVRKDEYTVSKVVQRMRAAKAGEHGVQVPTV